MATECECSKGKYIYIIGSYINACSIYRSIKSAGYTYPIMMLETAISQGKCLADIACRDAIVKKRTMKSKADILTAIGNGLGEQTEKYVLFTDETYMDTIANAIKSGELKNTIAYTGSKTGNEKIFDRLLFYQFINKLGVRAAKTPLTISGESDPFSFFGSIFIIRLRCSWHAGIVLPSITIVHNKREYEDTIIRFCEVGLTPCDWCFQELLSISDQHNISVCGWHDEEFHQYIVTRKVLQHPPRTGNGDVVENMLDYPRELTQATLEILSAMHYRGPFELEFVLDKRSNEYKIIELNPRFWMQHGLFEELTNHLLIKRSLQEDVEFKMIPPESFEHRYWINANRFWYRLCKGQLSILGYLRKGSCYPSLTESLRWMPYYRQYSRKLRG